MFWLADILPYVYWGCVSVSQEASRLNLGEGLVILFQVGLGSEVVDLTIRGK
jgi:hypothetical protein